MAAKKTEKCRKEWKRHKITSGMTRKQFIRWMMDAVAFSAAGQAELDKKRAKKKEGAVGDMD